MSPSKELRTLHIEEDITGVFHLYILPPKNAGETIINVKRDNITRISFSVFPNISQYTYDSFVAEIKARPRLVIASYTTPTPVSL